MRTGLWRVSIMGLLAASTAPASAEDAANLAARFGALEAVRQMALSPSGNQVAYVATIGPAQVLYVADVRNGGDSKGILKQVVGISTLRHCNWATDEHLLC
jgi:hypothetical protein